MLKGKGFEQVYDMKGGIRAWKGVKARGPVELNMDMITGEESAAGMIGIAYGMEEGLARFYALAAERTNHTEAAALLERLGSIEGAHKRRLVALYDEVVPGAGGEAALRANADYRRVEGGFELERFLKENERVFASPADCLQLAMMIEAQALDLYLRFTDKATDEKARRVLFKTAEEEKGHLAALGDLLDRLAAK